ncbi:unnamed protein product [Blepharisma stoltei]|uniref:ABC3 transporter permease C-terminal domain-containing protein n=1 Tax=Blepharisma stoltei TaxID=1481888 RepID=A0AAU9J1U9_9CILI|nr:unnamed protein product [Blepharisma stoltei]
MEYALKTWFFLKYGCIESKRHKVHFTLALLSCIIVVTVACVIQTVLYHAPLIFLRTAEGSSGEIDIKLTSENENYYLNKTRIEELISDKTAPRVVFGNSRANCVHCSTSDKKANIYFIDTKREKDIELGREYPYDPLKLGECMIHKKLALALHIEKGDKISLYDLDVNWWRSVFQSFTYEKNITVPSSFAMFYFTLELTVVDIFSKGYGKVADGSASSLVLAELSTLYQLYSQHIQADNYWPTTQGYSEFLTYLDTHSASDLSTHILISMPKPRTDTYMTSNYDNIQKKVTHKASGIVDDLGFYPVSVDLPIMDELQPLQYVTIFLGILLDLILVILFALSVILIYSLLLVSIETKTFELGVIRVLGLTKTGMVFMLVTQTMIFVIPAIIIGIFLSFGCNKIISDMFEEQIGVGFSPEPTPDAVGIAIMIGFLMPIIAGMSPLRQIFYSNLAESLDVSHSKSKAVSIKIEGSDSVVKRTIVWFGFVTVVFGFVVYLLLPLALLSFNLQLLLGIFLAILIAFLLGLVLLSMNFQYLFERATVLLFFWWESSAMRLMIVKNLAAHRLRNRKTTVMYALALAFIIFLSVMAEMQLTAASYRNLQSHGVKLVVQADPKTDDILPSHNLQLVVDNYGDIIDSYSWVTKELIQVIDEADATLLKNLGKAYEYNVQIYGVSPNLIDTIFGEFVIVTDRDTSTGLSLSEQLYTPEGTQGALMGTLYEDMLDLSVSPNSTFLVQVYAPYDNFFRVMRPIAFAESFSGFVMSKFPKNKKQSFLVSIPTWQDLAGKYAESANNVPMGYLMIKLATSDGDLIDKLYTDLNEVISYNDDLSIWDYRDSQSTAQQSAGLMSTVFSLVTLIAMFLCFFSLVSSMSANILEQAKEISVLRATGVRKIRIAILYVYEAFVLLFSAGLMGIMIGTFVAWTMSVQQVMFNDIPMPFIFPWEITIAVFVGSIICAFLASFFPSRKLVAKPIAELMRTLS